MSITQFSRLVSNEQSQKKVSPLSPCFFFVVFLLLKQKQAKQNNDRGRGLARLLRDFLFYSFRNEMKLLLSLKNCIGSIAFVISILIHRNDITIFEIFFDYYLNIFQIVIYLPECRDVIYERPQNDVQAENLCITKTASKNKSKEMFLTFYFFDILIWYKAFDLNWHHFEQIIVEKQYFSETFIFCSCQASLHNSNFDTTEQYLFEKDTFKPVLTTNWE